MRTQTQLLMKTQKYKNWLVHNNTYFFYVLSQSLGSLRRINLSGCESLKEIPDLSKATNLIYLDLTNCKSLVMLPSSIRNLKRLVHLHMEGCTGLEVLPDNVSLVSLNWYFNLSGCSRLRSFPQISTSITYLSLDYTAIEEVPSWIENISGLTNLTMRSCKKLKNVASNSFELKHLLEVDFSDCEGVTAFSDARAVTRTADVQLPVTEEASFHLGYLTVCAKNCKSLQSISHSFLSPMSCLKFHNCFNLDQDARHNILQSNFKSAVLPGGAVPTYFSHQAFGTSLTIPLPKSFLSQKVLRFKACIMLEPPTNYTKDSFAVIRVSWYFSGKSNTDYVYIDVDSCNGDHLVVFHFGFSPSKEVDGHPYELDFNDLKCKFEYHCNAISLQRIKGCGVRVLNVPASKDGSGTSSQTECNQQSEESDRDIGRSKKRMRMTVTTSEEPSNLLCGKTVANTTFTAPNLELSLGQGEASSQPSRSKLQSSSVSSSNLHGDGASLHLSLSPSEPCLSGKALYFDPMITEQQDTETPFVDPSSFSTLIKLIKNPIQPMSSHEPER